MALRDPDSPELQLWASLAHACNLPHACMGILRDDPIFMIHEAKIDPLKLLLAHHTFHCGDNLILFGSILDFININFWRLS